MHRSAGRVGVLVFAFSTAAFAQQRAAASELQTMRPVRVEESLDAVAETTLGKTAKSVRDIPQSVSIITHERLEQQNITSLPDAMKYTTGITVQRFDGAGIYNTFNARGYAADSFMLDGLNVRTNSNMADLDLAPFERIEVLRGAAGLFQGAGQPGVTLNFVRKRAQADAALETVLSAGSYGSYRADVDATGALSALGRVRGRVLGVYDDRDTHLDGVSARKKIGYGTVEFDVTNASVLSVGATYQDLQATTDQGLPAFADGRLLDVPRSTAVIAAWNLQDATTKDAFADYEVHFADERLFKVSMRRHDRESYYRSGRANGGLDAAGNFRMQYVDNFSDQQDLVTDAFFSTPFAWGGRSHTLLIGADYREGKTFAHHGDATPSATNGLPAFGNVFDYHRQIRLPEFVDSPTQRTRSRVEEYGIYTQATLRPVDRLSVILGGRVSWWETATRIASSDVLVSQGDEDARLTPYLGVVFDLDERFSLYTSYTSIFKPQTETTVTGAQLEPRTGLQYEAGIKGEFFAGALVSHLAAYRMTDRNRALQDPLNDGFAIAGGKVRSNGVEAEISGALTGNWSMTAGYSYVRTKYLKDVTTLEGQAFSPFTPKHSMNLWTHYAFDEGPLANVDLGVGVRAVTRFYSQSGAVRFVGDSYALASIAAGYVFLEKYKVSLNVENLFDKKYYEKVSNASRQNFYGAPRSFMITLRSRL